MRVWKYILISLVLLSASSFADGRINGIWKHTEKPAWLEINFESGVGSLAVKRHDNNVKAEGLKVIKDIEVDSNQSSQWLGKMYSAAVDGYVDVKLILINSSSIAVFVKDDVKNSNAILRMTRVVRGIT